MTFFKDFFTALYKSVTDVRWLRERRDRPNKAWTYFSSFMLLIVLIQMVSLLVTVPRGARQMWYRAQGQIPEFSATIEDGRLSVSELEQPFIVESQENGERFRLVIDTTSTTALTEDEVFDESIDAGIFITAERMAFYDAESGHRQAQAFPPDAEWQFDRAELIRTGDTFVRKTLPFLIPLIIFFVFIFWSLAKLAYLLFAAFLVWIASMFGGREWRFGQVYVVGLYAVTLPTIVNQLFVWMGIRLPFVYTILLLAFMLGAVFLGQKPAKKKTQKQTKKVTTPKKKTKTKRKTTNKKK